MAVFSTDVLRPSLLVLIVLTATGLGQGSPAVELGVDSGAVVNAGSSLQLAWSAPIHVPLATGLRLKVEELELGHPDDRLVIRGRRDSVAQRFDEGRLENWGHHSAWFNGDHLEVALLLHPGSTGRVVIDSAWCEWPVALAPGGDSLCGLGDARQPSSVARVGRVVSAPGFSCGLAQPVCNGTAFLIGTVSQILTSQRVMNTFRGAPAPLVEFNVPSSSASGNIVHPSPDDQFPLDLSSEIGSRSGVPGEDWARVRLLRNAIGQTVHARQGPGFLLASALPPVGSTLEIVGFGRDASRRSNNHVQMAARGPLRAIVGDRLEHRVDTGVGSEGSPVIDVATGRVIGIHSSGGCAFVSRPTGASEATSLFECRLQLLVGLPAACPPETLSAGAERIIDCDSVDAAFASVPATDWCAIAVSGAADHDLCAPEAISGRLGVEADYLFARSSEATRPVRALRRSPAGSTSLVGELPITISEGGHATTTWLSDSVMQLIEFRLTSNADRDLHVCGDPRLEWELYTFGSAGWRPRGDGAVATGTGIDGTRERLSLTRGEYLLVISAPGGPLSAPQRDLTVYLCDRISPSNTAFGPVTLSVGCGKISSQITPGRFQVLGLVGADDWRLSGGSALSDSAIPARHFEALVRDGRQGASGTSAPFVFASRSSGGGQAVVDRRDSVPMPIGPRLDELLPVGEAFRAHEFSVASAGTYEITLSSTDDVRFAVFDAASDQRWRDLDEPVASSGGPATRTVSLSSGTHLVLVWQGGPDPLATAVSYGLRVCGPGPARTLTGPDAAVLSGPCHAFSWPAARSSWVGIGVTSADDWRLEVGAVLTGGAAGTADWIVADGRAGTPPSGDGLAYRLSGTAGAGLAPARQRTLTPGVPETWDFDSQHVLQIVEFEITAPGDFDVGVQGGSDLAWWVFAPAGGPQWMEAGQSAFGGRAGDPFQRHVLGSGWHALVVVREGGLGVTAPFTLSVQSPLHPVPVLSSLVPDRTLRGGAATTISVTGGDFLPTSQVRWDGVALATTFLGSGQLTAQLAAPLLLNAGVVSVTVFSPGPGGGTSNAVPFTIENPVPVLQSLSPAAALQGGGAQIVSLLGTDFAPGATAEWDGVAVPSVRVSASQVDVTLSSAQLASSGVYPLVVRNPPPAGGSSQPRSFEVRAPVPTLSGLVPSVAQRGGTSLSVQLLGTGFTSASTATWNGGILPGQLVSSTELLATVDAALLAVAGSFDILVSTPGPGGGVSATRVFTVENPLPSVTQLIPDRAPLGTSAGSITLRGAGFTTESEVLWDGQPLPTIPVSSTQVDAALDATRYAVAGTFSLSVRTPAPGGGTSSSLVFVVENPVPNLVALQPATRLVGSGGFSLQVDGQGFVPGAAVTWDGVSLPTTFVSPTHVMASVDASRLGMAGIVGVAVRNPMPGGGISPVASFTVENDLPVISSMSPAGASVGDGSFTLLIDGTGFTGASMISWNGSSVPGTFVSSTRMEAQIGASLLAAAGPVDVTISNPAPGGGTSQPSVFLVSNPAPGLASIAPARTTTGSGPFTLVVLGTNFVPESMVTWDGMTLSTVWVSAQRLEATVDQPFLGAAGMHEIRVFTPGPGGGTSAAQTFVVENRLPVALSTSPLSTVVSTLPNRFFVNGTDFAPGAFVSWNGVPLPTLQIASTSIEAQLDPSLVATPAVVAITVTNPGPGGGTTPPVTFTVGRPVPQILDVTPATILVGSSATVVGIQGSGFDAGAIVTLDGTPLMTSNVMPNAISATIDAALLTTTGVRDLRVVNPAPGGGPSVSFAISVENPLPAITALSPDSSMSGSGPLQVTIHGTGFVPASVATWELLSLPTTFVDENTLQYVVDEVRLRHAGVFDLAVLTPTPGGGRAVPAAFTVRNPVPQAFSTSPPSTPRGTLPNRFFVNGTGLVRDSVVLWNGMPLPTLQVSSASIEAQLDAALVAQAASVSIQVTNNAPGGGTTQPVVFEVLNPGPVLGGLSPTEALVESATFDLVVSGTDFVPESVILWDGTARPTVFVSSTELRATIDASLLTVAGSFQITVSSPGPGGGTTSGSSFVVANPVPTLSSLAPSETLRGSGSTLLILNGSGFAPTASVQWNGQPLTTQRVDPTTLRVPLDASLLTSAMVAAVEVVNPSPGGGATGSLPFTVRNPVPVILDLLPSSSYLVGAVPSVLTVTAPDGSQGFTSGSVVEVGGVPLATTFVNEVTLNFAVPAGVDQVSGVYPVQVLNPSPGGGRSAARDLTVAEPQPVLSGLSPSVVTLGAVGPTTLVTLTGSGFGARSAVTLEGASGPPVLLPIRTWTTGTIEVDIPASLLTLPGLRHMQVVNPAPGGGSSSALPFSVDAPVPVLNAIQPALLNEPDLTDLTFTGVGFVAGALVEFRSGSVVAASLPAQVVTASVARLATFSPAVLTGPGVYDVRLVNPAPGGGASNWIPLTVLAQSMATFTAAPTSGEAPVTVTFQNPSLAPATPSTPRFWDFGDGLTQVVLGESVQHTYATPGTYSVTLKLLDLGAIAPTMTRTDLIVVQSPPIDECLRLERADYPLLGMRMLGGLRLDGDAIDDLVVVGPRGYYAISGADGLTLSLGLLPPGNVQPGINGIARAGDVDGDGVDDFAYSRYANGPVGPVRALWVVSGADPNVVLQQRPLTTGPLNVPRFSGGGDVNGDGRLDYVQILAGLEKVVVIDGATLQFLPGDFTTAANIPLSGISGDTYLLRSARIDGDFDGDGVDDLAVARGEENLSSHGGVVNVWSVVSGTSLLVDTRLDAIDPGDVADPLGNQRFAAFAGDLDGHPGDELAVSETWDRGEITLIAWNQGNPINLWSVGGASLGVWHLGGFLQGIGDTNGDGAPDLLCRATGPSGSEVVVVLSGADGSLIAIRTYGGGLDAVERIAPAGDCNGDGLADFFVALTPSRVRLARDANAALVVVDSAARASTYGIGAGPLNLLSLDWETGGASAPAQGTLRVQGGTPFGSFRFLTGPTSDYEEVNGAVYLVPRALLPPFFTTYFFDAQGAATFPVGLTTSALIPPLFVQVQELTPGRFALSNGLQLIFSR